MKTSKTCILILLFCRVVTVLGGKAGPYKTSMIKVAPCANPTLPVEKTPGSYYYAELYNTTTETNLMKGNLTVVKDRSRVSKMKAKSYKWENNKWKVNNLVNNMACNSVYFPALISTLKTIKYDPKTCSFAKGVYPFSNFSIDKMQHVWMNTQEYGKVLWKFEVYSSSGTVFCYEFETVIERRIK